MADIVSETNRYATIAIAKKPDPYWSPLDVNEFKAFFRADGNIICCARAISQDCLDNTPGISPSSICRDND